MQPRVSRVTQPFEPRAAARAQRRAPARATGASEALGRLRSLREAGERPQRAPRGRETQQHVRLVAGR